MTYPPPAYGYPAYGPPPDHPKATTVLVLGILGFVCCQLCAPFAWVMGKNALNDIDASGGMIGGRSNVMVGYVLGIVGTVLIGITLLGLIAYIIIVVIAMGAST